MLHDEELAKNMTDYYNLFLPNPFYPVQIEDYPKLKNLIITTTGLIYFNELKRRFTMGEKLSYEELHAYEVLCLFHGLANRSPEVIHEWEDISLRIRKENPDFHNFKPKQKLTKLGYLMKNEEYDPELYSMHREWQKKSLEHISKKNTFSETEDYDDHKN